jgi:hypothetical protein
MSSDALLAPCPGCQKTLRIPPEKSNRTVRCKNCGTRFNPSSATAPESEDIVPPGDLGLVVRLPQVRSQSKGKRWLVAALLIFALGVGAGFALLPPTKDAATYSSPDTGRKPATEIAAPDFPRRALAICISNYLYARPVNSGLENNNIHALLTRLGSFLHIPADQFGVLTDVPAPAVKSADKKKPATPPSPLVPPLKKAVESAVTSFLATSRPQDHVLLFWVGHVNEIDGVSYLVPIDGELNVKETLIPLTWLFDRLGACKARQKVLIVDACRKAGAGEETPPVSPLGKKTAELLSNPPAGTQILSACGSGQFSYEGEDGGLFLKKLRDSLTQKTLKKKIQEPSDPLPIEEIALVAAKSTTAVVSENQHAQQTPGLFGREAAGDIADDAEPSEPLKVVIGLPPKPGEAAGIFREIVIPPLTLDKNQAPPPPIEMLVSFADTDLAPYRRDSIPAADYAKKYPLRAAVVAAIELLRRSFASTNDAFMIQEINAGSNREKLKAEIVNMQSKTAGIYEKLNEGLVALEGVEEDRKSETSKRWQAHCDYVHAQLLLRIAFVYEYDLMLGKIRTDSLPTPEGYSPSGWRLAFQEKLQSGKEIREKLAQSNKILDKIIKQYPGTPWAVLAKRDRLQPVGLHWEPYR